MRETSTAQAQPESELRRWVAVTTAQILEHKSLERKP